MICESDLFLLMNSANMQSVVVALDTLPFYDHLCFVIFISFFVILFIFYNMSTLMFFWLSYINTST